MFGICRRDRPLDKLDADESLDQSTHQLVRRAPLALPGAVFVDCTGDPEAPPGEVFAEVKWVQSLRGEILDQVCIKVGDILQNCNMFSKI